MGLLMRQENGAMVNLRFCDVPMRKEDGKGRRIKTGQ